MAERHLIQLAQDLEWLGCELEHYGRKHAWAGFPESGATWETFVEKQRGVLVTAEKIERELKSEIKFNPASLVGIDYPISQALDSVSELLAALENIKLSAVEAVQNLPASVRNFSKMVGRYVESAGSLPG